MSNKSRFIEIRDSQTVVEYIDCVPYVHNHNSPWIPTQIIIAAMVVALLSRNSLCAAVTFSSLNNGASAFGLGFQELMRSAMDSAGFGGVPLVNRRIAFAEAAPVAISHEELSNAVAQVELRAELRAAQVEQ